MPVPCFRAKAGHVYLVGAGPGDPGLLTLKARDLLASCDCLLFDHLVDEGIVAFAHPRAERMAVGKIGHGSQTSQAEIDRLLIDRASRGRAVVRLKGGCPTLFGRVAEEAMALRGAGIPYEIVPGVTSALAVPAYAGIPATHRGLAASVAIVTGHCVEEDRRPLAAVAHADTLLILMGVRSLPSIVAELLAAGRPPSTPAAFVSRGTGPEQRTAWATLGSLCDVVARAGLAAPAVIVVGEVVTLGEPLAWFGTPRDVVVASNS